jgi:hypothetical protein
MTRLPRLALALLFACTAAGADGWEPVVRGVEYRHIAREGTDAHAVRVKLDVRSLEVVATAAAERGRTVSEFALGRGAVVAINGDYFDTSLNPIGLAMGDGEVWAQANEAVRRQEVGKLSQGVLAAAGGHEQHGLAAAGHVDEHGDVLVPVLGGGLVQADAAHVT